MPTVIYEGEFRFTIHTHELPYEPPHVHVIFGGNEVRINLDSGNFMESPPPGKGSEIMKIYRENCAKIRKKWDRIHEAG